MDRRMDARFPSMGKGRDRDFSIKRRFREVGMKNREGKDPSTLSISLFFPRN